MDKTYVRLRTRRAYLYRAIDKQYDTIEFHWSPTRNAKSATRLLAKAKRRLRASARPGVINTDKAATYGAAVAALKTEGKLGPDTQHRQVQSLNNRLEAGHGKLKRLIMPILGFQSMEAAFATIKASKS